LEPIDRFDEVAVRALRLLTPLAHPLGRVDDDLDAVSFRQRGGGPAFDDPRAAERVTVRVRRGLSADLRARVPSGAASDVRTDLLLHLFGGQQAAAIDPVAPRRAARAFLRRFP